MRNQRTVMVCEACKRVFNEYGCIISEEHLGELQKEIDRGHTNVDVGICKGCNKVEVELYDGDKIIVDKSPENCLQFGFKHKEEIITCFGEKVVVMGVAPAPDESPYKGASVLWYKKGDGISYYLKPGNLREAGFRGKDEETSETERREHLFFM